MSINVGGKEFEFIKPTFDFLERWVDGSETMKYLENVDLIAVAKERAEGARFRKAWKDFCGLVFMRKGFAWKYLGVLPKELRVDQIEIPVMFEVVKSFFVYAGAGMSAQKQSSTDTPDSRARASQG